MNIEKLLGEARRETGARLAKDDPILVAAFLTEKVLAEARAAEREQINALFAAVDQRLDEMAELRASLPAIGGEIAQAAEAQIARGQADLARLAADRIAMLAAADMRRLGRTAWLWAVSGAAAVALLTFVAGVLFGSVLGADRAARTLDSANGVIRDVAAAEGLSAVRDWTELMRANPIEEVLRGCAGGNVATQGGGTGCRMWLRISK